MKLKYVIYILALTVLVQPAAADIVIGDGITEISDPESYSIMHLINNWLRQTLQVLENQLDFIMRESDHCQVVIANTTDYKFQFINQRAVITEYYLDEYLPVGEYYWKVRCWENDQYTMWSDTWMYNHTAVNGSDGKVTRTYFDWTLIR